jgi:hypothetical protein
VWFPGKNTIAKSPSTYKRCLSKRRLRGQETEVNTVEEGDINELAGEEVVMGETEHRQAKK